jgi:hypothetical protein
MHKKFLLGHPCLMESNIYLEVLVENPTRCNKSFCMKPTCFNIIYVLRSEIIRNELIHFLFSLKRKNRKKNKNKNKNYFLSLLDRFFYFRLLRCINLSIIISFIKHSRVLCYP